MKTNPAKTLIGLFVLLTASGKSVLNDGLVEVDGLWSTTLTATASTCGSVAPKVRANDGPLTRRNRTMRKFAQASFSTRWPSPKTRRCSRRFGGHNCER